MILRDYQLRAIDDVTTAAAQGHRRIILVAPTGSGKTCIASRIISSAVANGNRVLFLAPTRELVAQTSDKLTEICVPHGIMMSGEPYDPLHPVVVSSLPSQYAWCVRRRKENHPKADLVIFDEAHSLFSATTWQKVADAYPQAFILGMTATPINRAGRGMQHAFDAMVQAPTIQSLTDLGHLVKVRYFVPSIPDLANIKVQAGDYSEKQLETRMDQPKLIGDIIENWSRIAPTKKTLVFASGVKHSIHLVESFKAIGIKAAHVDGNTPKEERDETTKAFREGDLQVLSNCAVYRLGADFPRAECLVFARPTKSVLLYLQVSGRVLRPSPGKSSCILIDHAGVYAEHGPVAQDWDWKLDYGTAKTVKGAMAARKKKKPVDITCAKCKVVFTGVIVCPLCGERITLKGKHVETWPAYLQELAAADAPKVLTLKEMRRWYLMMLHYRRSRGKSDGAAYVWYLAKFGIKPPWRWKDETPIEPSIEVLGYIKSRQIAYAHSRKPTHQEVGDEQRSIAG